MTEHIDPIRLYRELREKQQRGDRPHQNAVVTRRVLAVMESFEERAGEIPEDERDLARATLWSCLANRAIGELEERVIALEERNSSEDRRRTFEDLQFRSASAGWR